MTPCDDPGAIAQHDRSDSGGGIPRREGNEGARDDHGKSVGRFSARRGRACRAAVVVLAGLLKAAAGAHAADLVARDIAVAAGLSFQGERLGLTQG